MEERSAVEVIALVSWAVAEWGVANRSGDADKTRMCIGPPHRGGSCHVAGQSAGTPSPFSGSSPISAGDFFLPRLQPARLAEGETGGEGGGGPAPSCEHFRWLPSGASPPATPRRQPPRTPPRGGPPLALIWPQDSNASPLGPASPASPARPSKGGNAPASPRRE